MSEEQVHQYASKRPDVGGLSIVWVECRHLWRPVDSRHNATGLKTWLLIDATYSKGFSDGGFELILARLSLLWLAGDDLFVLSFSNLLQFLLLLALLWESSRESKITNGHLALLIDQDVCRF